LDLEDPRDQWDRQDHKVVKGWKEPEDPLDLAAYKDPKDLKVLPARKDPKDPPDPKEPLAHKDPKETSVSKVLLVWLVPPVQLALKV
jgi:hypothetical protein